MNGNILTILIYKIKNKVKTHKFIPKLDSLLFEPIAQITYGAVMFYRYIKIVLLLTSLLFTTGFLPFAAVVGPATTIFTSGNVYKATAQFIIDQSIKKKTGKSSLTLVKDEIEKQESERSLNKELKILVEKRINIARQKLEFQKINQ
tara:strand:- start:109 stop:549 length:441 start_codon:yes stop_codon:yes gene_type:complete